MQIKEMFEKQIDRDIKGVIKVGQSDEENVYQELDEYVVTKELLKHFRDFFDNYEKGINNNTDKMGVWISGFFGSGKSHFLKILSYLLKNSVVEGKRAIEYFTDGKKIEDPMLIAKMTNSGTISSDVMLFNIDSKGSAKVGSGKEAIVEVFMKVFNEMQGYCGSIPYLAEFERQLDNEGRFEEFKEKFQEIAGAPWEKKRQAFAVIQDKIVKTIVAMDFMSEEAARNWCKNAKGSYDLSIEKFVSLVKEYCEKKGPNHHVIFLVDEIGQYIADDTQLMLNLQTIVEDLGTACRGKAWVIVTSQEDIDSITKTKGNDFSKIQGRFDTRLSLSASNVDEVIRKRILEKNEIAESALKLLYEQKESIIKNLITFTADTADKKLYTDKTDFADCYPFIPYQFNLLGQVLTAVRTHGASGKHLSDQSRSMLALFQESAIRLKDSQEGVLVPFSYFYDPLHKFIDHQHSQVITDAVVTNPPYMGASGMGTKLSEYVKNHYSDSKSDLFAVFIEKWNTGVRRYGFNCMVTMQSWMFLSSFEKLRINILNTKDITNLMHMENMVMGIAFGTAVTIFRDSHVQGYKGTYNQIKLCDIENNQPKCFPVMENRFSQVSTEKFAKIPGNPVAYWASKKVFEAFEMGSSLGNMGIVRNGMKTGNNDVFLRLWWEVNNNAMNYNAKNYEMAVSSHAKWFPYNKGGEYRKWYGNNDWVINWENGGVKVIGEAKKEGRHVQDYPNDMKFLPALTWSLITSSKQRCTRGTNKIKKKR